MYGIWDSNQLKIGPVSDGNANSTIFKLIPILMLGHEKASTAQISVVVSIRIELLCLV